MNLYTIPWPKVPLLLPAPKRECCIFGTGIVKNSIRNTGVKLDSRYLVEIAIRAWGKYIPPLVRNILLLTVS